MSLKNKGFLLYEIIICLTILLLISSSLLSVINNLFIRSENKKLTYQMKQYLTVNIILLENHEDLVIDDNYSLILKDNYLCIVWRDLYEQEKTICEKVWV